MRVRLRLVGIRLAALGCVVVAFPLVLCSASPDGPGAEGTPPAPPTGPIEQTNAQEVIRAYLQLQGQLRATQLAIERNGQETKEAAAQTAETLSNALQAIQGTFVVQRARELEETREFGRRILIVAGAFAAVGMLTMLLIAYFQWCMSRGLAAVSAALPAALRLGPEIALDALGPAEQPKSPLLGPAEAQEGPPHHLERASQPAVKPRRGSGRSIERLLFPRPGDSLRRRQFRALRTAMLFGLACATVLALVLYLMYLGPKM